jgi:16S rRNA (adenine1518-N6/adenine1519-N6)-dimethyltransferase
MVMQSLGDIRRLLDERGLRPSKALGQNFLIDQNLVRKLADSAGVGGGDLVLEVGPGTGVLTEELLGRGCEVIACELDAGLCDLLRDRLGGETRFALIEGDCLAGKRRLSAQVVEAVGGRPFSLVANLPYGAATPLVLTLLVEHPMCGGLFVTIQREVAERLLAKPGTREYGSISVIARALARVERIATLPPSCFWPRPEVTSTMVALRRLAPPLTDDPAGFAEFCARAFAKRRKQLGAVFGRSLGWPMGIEPRQRAESLTVEQFVALHRAVEGEPPADGKG